MSTVGQSLIKLIHDSIGNIRMYDRYNLLLRMLVTQNPSNLSIELENSSQFIEQCKRCVNAMGEAKVPILQEQYFTSTDPVTLTALGQALLTDYLQPLLTPKPPATSPSPAPSTKPSSGADWTSSIETSLGLPSTQAAAGPAPYQPSLFSSPSSSIPNEQTQRVIDFLEFVKNNVPVDRSGWLHCGGLWVIKRHSTNGNLVMGKISITPGDPAPQPLIYTVLFNEQTRILSFKDDRTKSMIDNPDLKKIIMTDLLESTMEIRTIFSANPSCKPKA